MAKANRLNVKKIDGLSKPGIHGDGNCLFLRVRPGGSKQWIQIVQVAGRRIERGLGGYPLVSLQEARETAFENRRALRRGENPFVGRRALSAAISTGTAVSNAPTFADALEAVLDIRRPSWDNPKGEPRWRATLARYAMPVIGNMPVDAVAMRDVEAILTPIWQTKCQTARNVKQRIHAVMAWAIAHGHRTDNPVDAVNAILPKQNEVKEHRKALPYAEVPQAVAAIRRAKAHVSTRLAFEFAILTAARGGEARGAVWDEVDLDAATWTVPAKRMKAKAEHVVPLSNAAVAVLEAAAAEFGKEGVIFPSMQRKVMCDAALSNLAKAIGIAAVPHGFRSSFRNWCAENGVERDVAEAALAHSVGGSVELRYKTTRYFEKRREVMERWAAHCEPTKGQLAIAAKRRREREAA